MTPCKSVSYGKPDAKNPHVRFDEGEVAPAKPRRVSLLYKRMMAIAGSLVAACGGFCGESADWLLNAKPYRAHIERSDRGIVLDNGLARREIRLAPGAVTTSLKCVPTGEEFIRGVLPEAYVTLDGVNYPVGGVEGQSVLNYFREEWLDRLNPTPDSYSFVGAEIGDIEERFAWKRRPEWLARDVAWPPKGKHLVMRYRPPAAVADGERGEIFGKQVLAWDSTKLWDGSWREVVKDEDSRATCRNEGKPGEIMIRKGSLAYLEHDWPKDVACVAATVDCGTDTDGPSQRKEQSVGLGVVLVGKDGKEHFASIALSPTRKQFWTTLDGEEYSCAAGFDPTKRVELRIGRVGSVWSAFAFQGKTRARIELPIEGSPKVFRAGKVTHSPGEKWNRLFVHSVMCRSEKEMTQKSDNAELPLVEVHYEIYDGAPLVSKWLVVSNTTKKAITVNTFTVDQIRFPERSGGTDHEWGDEVPVNFRAESNYTYYYHWHGNNSAAIHFGTDPDYTSQEAWSLNDKNVMRAYPDQAPCIRVEPGKSFETFRVWEVLFDSTDRERRGLTLRRMYRIIAPWTCENPLMFHKTNSDAKSIREAIEQCRQTGFELVIISFWSGFDHSSKDPSYRAIYRELADEAREKGVVLGGYSLTAVAGAHKKTLPKEEQTQGVPGCFGPAPCLATKWGRDYFDTLGSFMKEAGFGVFENDGPYPGNLCAATNHAYHAGLADSRWMQWRAQSDFYRFCRANAIYVNQPDWYFLEGGSKGCGGYRESNNSLPRAHQQIIERQVIFDNSWNSTTSMRWQFVPLSVYQGGGAAATIEPLSEHCDYYASRFDNLLSAGSQACWRGPRLYDSPRVLDMVKEKVAFYKRYRRIFDGDLIHIRRADGRDWDGWLMIDPDLKDDLRGIATIFNPLNKAIVREVTLPLYYAGLSGRAAVRIGEKGASRLLPLDAACRATLKLEIPASGCVHVFIGTSLQ